MSTAVSKRKVNTRASEHRAELSEAVATANAKLHRGLPFISDSHKIAMARIGVERPAAATDWLFVKAVEVLEHLQHVTATAPDYVRERFPKPGMVDAAIAARVAYLCNVG